MPEDKNEVADALAGSGGDGETGKLGNILKILLPVGIVVLFGAAGYFASGLNVPAQAGAEETESTPDPDKSTQDNRELIHHELESIIINLNEPQVTRYLRVALSLDIAGEDYNTAKVILKKKAHDVKNWLITYLCDLSLEDVRGAKNINRARRAIQDSLNNKLWPGGRPLIVNVSLKEWIVQ